jgi:cytochrome c2
MPSYRLSALVVPLVLLGCTHAAEQEAHNLVGGNSESGKLAIEKYGCPSCHTIPGIRSARSKVGPNLDGIAARSYVAGVIPNSPDNLMRWIKNPPAVDDKTAMPNMGVTDKDARDIATYLYTLR